MNTLHAGLMCTLLLVGTIAGLFGCMSAVRCRRRLVFALCLGMTALDFAPLAVLLSRLPESETLSPVPWTAAALSLTASGQAKALSIPPGEYAGNGETQRN